MKITGVRHIEDCFDGSYVHEILFDADITSTFIESLGTEGKLQYYRSFARPFFKAVLADRFTIKGVEGNRTIRVLSYEENLERTLDHLNQLIAVSEGSAYGAGCEDAMQGTDAAKGNNC